MLHFLGKKTAGGWIFENLNFQEDNQSIGLHYLEIDEPDFFSIRIDRDSFDENPLK